MSCHYHAFVGPYVEVHNPLRVGTKQVKTCTKKGCVKHGQPSEDSFCPKCGSAIGEVNIPCKERKKFYPYEDFGFKTDISKLSKESTPLPDDYEIFYFPTKKGPGRTLYETCAIVPMDAAFVQAEIDTLASRYTKEVSRLKEIFGNDSVKIKWGVFTYWS